MSRCFAFPPPGYVRNGLSGEALIESIKREIEKAKTEKKKERRKERKEKRKKQKTLQDEKSCVTEEHKQPIFSHNNCYLSDSTSNKRKRCTTLYDNQMKKEKALYKSLIEDWVPIPVQFEQNDIDDQDWLFGTTQQERCKRLKAGDDDDDDDDDDVQGCCGSPSLWPRAHYLPEADIYALPYIIPF